MARVKNNSESNDEIIELKDGIKDVVTTSHRNCSAKPPEHKTPFAGVSSRAADTPSMSRDVVTLLLCYWPIRPLFVRLLMLAADVSVLYHLRHADYCRLHPTVGRLYSFS